VTLPQRRARTDYLEIATLTIGYRKLGRARYHDPQATIAATVSAAMEASTHPAAIDAMERVIEAAERDGEERLYWDGTVWHTAAQG
jgi:hypothetical protein